MIFFADAVLDEQGPTSSFVQYFINACAECVKNPAAFVKYSIPDGQKYFKVKAALIYASEVGKALNILENWAEKHDKINEFKKCKQDFLIAFGRLKDAEIEGFEYQQNPTLSIQEYNKVTEGKSVNIFYAGVSIIIPLTQEALEIKEQFLLISELTTQSIHVQMCDDIQDLREDLPDWFTISSHLNELEGYEKLKKEFLTLVNAARLITSLDTKSKETERIINQMKSRMIDILWETGILPRILQQLGSLSYYKPFRQETIKILRENEFNKRFRMELKLALIGLSGIQFLFANALLLKRKLRFW